MARALFRPIPSAQITKGDKDEVAVEEIDEPQEDIDKLFFLRNALESGTVSAVPP